jgi:zinc finger protein-like protein
VSGPLQMYLYIHDAILREVADLEGRARELNRDDSEEIAELSNRLKWFHKMVKQHEDAEEEVLFPAMNNRYRFVAETYEYDHDDFEAHVFDGLDDALAGLARANGNNERRESARLFFRQSVALHEHMRLHISKENELLLPKLASEFDVSEQAEIAGAMAGMFEPQLMAETVGFMYRGQSPADRVGMVEFLMNLLPPEGFANLTDALKAHNEKEWAEVERRIPDL